MRRNSPPSPPAPMRRRCVEPGYGFSSKPDPGPWGERNGIYNFDTWSRQVGGGDTRARRLLCPGLLPVIKAVSGAGGRGLC